MAAWVFWRSGLAMLVVASQSVVAATQPPKSDGAAALIGQVPAISLNDPGAPGDEVPFSPGETKLHWTAPVDEGGTGRAFGYDLRFQPYAAGPINSDQEWQAADQVANEPAPSAPGQRDSIVVAGLDYGAGYFFCIRSYDIAGNYSAISNSPLRVSGDTTGYDYILGDVNGNGVVNGVDVVYLVAYFKGIGSPPLHIMSADANGDCIVNPLDVLYLVRYLKGGLPLVPGDC